MAFTQQQSTSLMQQLPLLTFVPEQDAEIVANDNVQNYLNFYRINFSHTMSNITHGFGYFNAAGFRIAGHYWLPENPRATLVVMHGYYDHVGLFSHVIEFALTQNLAVISFDLPGHGLSSGEPAVIDSFDQYADVLAIYLKHCEALCTQPLYCLGQSTGCAVIMNYLWRYAETQHSLQNFKKIVFCAPLVLPRAWQIGRFAYMLARHFLQRLPRGKSSSSHDQRFNDFVSQQDPLQAKYLSVRWVGAMQAWHHRLNQLTPLQQDVLIIQGDADMTVEWRYNLTILKRQFPASQLVMIGDAKHQLVNESAEYRRLLFTAITRYLTL